MKTARTLLDIQQNKYDSTPSHKKNTFFMNIITRKKKSKRSKKQRKKMDNKKKVTTKVNFKMSIKESKLWQSFERNGIFDQLNEWPNWHLLWLRIIKSKWCVFVYLIVLLSRIYGNQVVNNILFFSSKLLRKYVDFDYDQMS